MNVGSDVRLSVNGPKLEQLYGRWSARLSPRLLARLVVQRLHAGGELPRAAPHPLLLLGPLAVLVEVGAGSLLGFALAVAAHPEPVEEVDRQHGQAAADGHREAVDPESGRIDDQHHDAGHDHHRADAVPEDQHPDRPAGYRRWSGRLSHKLAV